MLIGMIGEVLRASERLAEESDSQPLPWRAQVRRADGRSVRRFLCAPRRYALLFLALASCYRISDIVMGVMANPFYRRRWIQQRRGAEVSKGLRPRDDAGRRVCRRLAGGPLRRAPHPAGGGRPRPRRPVLLFAWLAPSATICRCWLVAVTADNFASGVAGNHLHRLSIRPHQCAFHRNPVRAAQFADGAAAEAARGHIGNAGQCIRLSALFRRRPRFWAFRWWHWPALVARMFERQAG